MRALRCSRRSPRRFRRDIGVEVASLGVQVHGGMGFIEETGAAQLYRDARIAPIYEGTNGIQAIDLVTRKLPLAGGAAVEAYIGELRAHRRGGQCHQRSGLRLDRRAARAMRSRAWRARRTGCWPVGRTSRTGARRRDALSAAVRGCRAAAACWPNRRSRRCGCNGDAAPAHRARALLCREFCGAGRCARAHRRRGRGRRAWRRCGAAPERACDAREFPARIWTVPIGCRTLLHHPSRLPRPSHAARAIRSGRTGCARSSARSRRRSFSRWRGSKRRRRRSR